MLRLFDGRLLILVIFTFHQICCSNSGTASSVVKKVEDSSEEEDLAVAKRDSWITKLLVGPASEDIYHNRAKTEKLYATYVNSLVTKVKYSFNGMKNVLTGHRGETQDTFCHSKEKRTEGCRTLLSKAYYKSRGIVFNPNKDVGECVVKKLIVQKDRSWTNTGILNSEPKDKMVFTCPYVRVDELLLSQGANDRSAFVYDEYDDNSKGNMIYLDGHVIDVVNE